MFCLDTLLLSDATSKEREGHQGNHVAPEERLPETDGCSSGACGRKERLRDHRKIREAQEGLGHLESAGTWGRLQDWDKGT